MYFLDKNGEIQEGLPLSEQSKQTLDQMAEFFHKQDHVCADYAHTYGVKKCLILAVAFIRRFDVIQKADYVEVIAEEPEVMPAVPEPPPLGVVVVDDSIPF